MIKFSLRVTAYANEKHETNYTDLNLITETNFGYCPGSFTSKLISLSDLTVILRCDYFKQIGTHTQRERKEHLKVLRFESKIKYLKCENKVEKKRKCSFLLGQHTTQIRHQNKVVSSGSEHGYNMLKKAVYNKANSQFRKSADGGGWRNR